MQQPYVVPRRRLAIALWFTALALPILLIDNLPRTDAKADQAKVAALAVVAPATLPPTSAPATTTSLPPTTEPVTVAPPSTARPVAAAKKQAPATTVPSRPPTTLARPTAAAAPAASPAPSVAPAPSGGHSEDGQATFYDYRPGECAHKTIPKGTVVTVTNVDNGKTTSCTVTDRGPFGAGRIIDLDRGTFAAIAPVGQGVAQVHITW
ncbi:MAG: RlpA-like double-psi beta-barrel domain-containing protein [Acidimicrobiales bacterium]